MVEALILLNFAETVHLAGSHQQAGELALSALLIYRHLAHQRGIGLALRVLGNACASRGDTAAACLHWTEVHAVLNGVDTQLCEELMASLDHVRS